MKRENTKVIGSMKKPESVIKQGDKGDNLGDAIVKITKFKNEFFVYEIENVGEANDSDNEARCFTNYQQALIFAEKLVISRGGNL